MISICEGCSVLDFVHADLYCQDCTKKPKPKIKTGIAYLFKKDTFRPVTSVEVKAPAGLEYDIAAVKLMSNFKIEFIGDDG